MNEASLAAIVVAAGSSRRMGFDKLTVLLDGKPLVTHSLTAFQTCADVSRIVLVCAEDRLPEFEALARPFSKIAGVVAGGRERVDSVLAGVAALGNPAPDFVAVHDGARPLITPQAISQCFEAARVHGASVSAEPVTDTLHRVSGEELTIETVARERLWRMQTPQTMNLGLLTSLLEGCRGEGAAVTDEISLLIRTGRQAKVVDSGDWNLKVTYPRDLELAEMIIQSRKRIS